jgi:hypothetical protein
MRSICGIRPLQQSVDECPGLQQIRAGGEGCGLSLLSPGRLGLFRGVQIGPVRRHQGLGSVGQHQCQVQLAVSVTPSQHVERHALKGMALADDLYLVGIVVEVGSLSGGLLTTCGTICCSTKWRSE